MPLGPFYPLPDRLGTKKNLTWRYFVLCENGIKTACEMASKSISLFKPAWRSLLARLDDNECIFFLDCAPSIEEQRQNLLHGAYYLLHALVQCFHSVITVIRSSCSVPSCFLSRCQKNICLHCCLHQLSLHDIKRKSNIAAMIKVQADSKILDACFFFNWHQMHLHVLLRRWQVLMLFICGYEPWTLYPWGSWLIDCAT